MLNRVVVGLAAALLSLAGPAGTTTFPGYGTVSFPTSCAPAVQLRLEKIIARLHLFDWVKPDATALADSTKPPCAMAYWAAAMGARGNPLAGTLDDEAIASGRSLIAQARAALDADAAATEREKAFIAALEIYYRDYPGGQPQRTRAYEAAMEKVYRLDPDDPELATFYALAILEAVDLTDKTYARQLQAIAILDKVWKAHPDHAGAMHYLLHASDYAPLANRGLAAARQLPKVATASQHAQHMPSHIYSMLGLWRQSIAANHDAAQVMDHHLHGDVAKTDALDSHGLDFIVYARLQLGEDAEAAAAIAKASPSAERVVAQARYVLERHDWTTTLASDSDSSFDLMTIHFTRSIAAARSGDPATAAAQARALRQERERVQKEYGDYWAGLIDVYAEAADAWVAAKTGNADAAIAGMKNAAALDDAREKHIFLENKLLPMRELYGELLLELGRPSEALAEFTASLAAAPNRLRSFAGAAAAATAMGQPDLARPWLRQLVDLTRNVKTSRPEILEARRLTGS